MPDDAFNNYGVTQARSVVKYSGHGGGRWYAFNVLRTMGCEIRNFLLLKISGTNEPLWFYGFNDEKDMGH